MRGVNDLAPPAQEGGEQIEFLAGERHGQSVDEHLAGAHVQGQPFDLELVVRRFAGRGVAAENGANARAQQFFRSGLEEVVVRALAETLEFRLLVRQGRGQQDDGQRGGVGAGFQFRAELEAGAVFAHVHEHEVGLPRLHLGEQVVHGDHGNLKAVFGDEVAEHLCEGGVGFHQQHHPSGDGLAVRGKIRFGFQVLSPDRGISSLGVFPVRLIFETYSIFFRRTNPRFLRILLADVFSWPEHRGVNMPKKETSSAKTEMSLNEGDPAPDFSLQDDTGRVRTLKDFRGKKLVLYFYPKDATSGCTREACDFRDNMNRVVATGAAVVGVSADSVESHKRFKEKQGLNFPLLSDPERKMLKAYCVWQQKTLYGRLFMGIVRATFIIDEKGVITKIFPKVKVTGHVDEVLALLRTAK